MTEVTVTARILREMEREIEELMRDDHLEKSAALRKIWQLGLEGCRRERAVRLLGAEGHALPRRRDREGQRVGNALSREGAQDRLG